jgi:hypothetical protein
MCQDQAAPAASGVWTERRAPWAQHRRVDLGNADQQVLLNAPCVFVWWHVPCDLIRVGTSGTQAAYFDTLIKRLATRSCYESAVFQPGIAPYHSRSTVHCRSTCSFRSLDGLRRVCQREMLLVVTL